MDVVYNELIMKVEPNSDDKNLTHNKAPCSKRAGCFKKEKRIILF